jgi:hypothetical protein
MHAPTCLPTALTLCTLASLAQAETFSVGPLPGDAPPGFSQLFTKHVDVLGLHVYASSQTPNAKVIHAANILAQWIDNNEDGQLDDPAVHQTMTALHASMLMWSTENEFENSGAEDTIPDWVWDSTVLQPLFGAETNPGYPGNQEFDWALEECLHLVTWGGFSRTYPSVFGEYPGSQIGIAMIANIAGGWYHYDDPTCDFACKVTEYHYWALTSMLGAQNYSWRIGEIIDEWELYSPQLVQQHDAAVHALLSDGQWHQATVLPDGSYEPQAACTGDLNGDGLVDVDDILAVINAWGTDDANGDADGDGAVTANDILVVLAGWGACP